MKVDQSIWILECAQRVHISAKLKTRLSAHRHTNRQTDRQTDKSENSISASFTPFTWRIWLIDQSMAEVWNATPIEDCSHRNENTYTESRKRSTKTTPGQPSALRMAPHSIQLYYSLASYHQQHQQQLLKPVIGQRKCLDDECATRGDRMSCNY